MVWSIKTFLGLKPITPAAQAAQAITGTSGAPAASAPAVAVAAPASPATAPVDIDPTVAVAPVAPVVVDMVTQDPALLAATTNALPPRVKMNGFDGKPLPKVNINITPSPGQRGAAETRSDLQDGGWVDRGYIKVGFKPAVGGVDISVESRHKKPSDLANWKGDNLVVYLQGRVRDGKTERLVTIATLFDGLWNPEKTSTTTRRWHVSYEDLNAWLKQKSDHLQFSPTNPLAAYAVWKDDGHQWGSFTREGYFEAPMPLGDNGALQAKLGQVVDTPVLQEATDAAKPIDITHAIPEDVIKAYPLALAEDAKFVSRREHEQKFCTLSLDDLRSVTLDLMSAARSDRRAKEKILLDKFGPDEGLSKLRGYPVSGWELTITDRYYAKDAAGVPLVGADGLPIVQPMLDVYPDDASGQGTKRFPLATENMAMRFRDGEIKAGSNVGSMGKLNMKSKRIADPFTLIQTGHELSVDTRPGISKNPAAMGELISFLKNGKAPYNPMHELKKNNYSLSADVLTKAAGLNLAKRYKFTLEHANGMKLEISMDFVHTGFLFDTKVVPATAQMSEAEKYDHYVAMLSKSPADLLVKSGDTVGKGQEVSAVVLAGTGDTDLTMAVFWIDETGAKRCTEHPAVRFPQVEDEMDHVQARTVGPVQEAYQTPDETKTLENDADQDAFLKGLTENATMAGPPTSHVWEDLKNTGIYEDPNYVQMSKAVTSMRKGFFKNGIKAARQKFAQALEIGGYIPKKTVELTASVPYESNRGVSVETNHQQKDTLLVKSSGYNSYGYGMMGMGGMGGNTNTQPAQAPRTLGSKPTTISFTFDGFPFKMQFTGKETAAEVAHAIQKRLDEAVVYKAVLTEQNGTFTIQMVSRDAPTAPAAEPAAAPST